MNSVRLFAPAELTTPPGQHHVQGAFVVVGAVPEHEKSFGWPAASPPENGAKSRTPYS